MLRISWTLFVSLALTPIAFGQTAKPDPKSRIRLETDIVYRTVDDKTLKLDLAMPKEGKGPFPAVVCVHGGAWRMGNKKDVRDWIEYLADQGYVAIAVGYRLIPDAKWPAQVEDVQTAVRFLRTNADKYHVNPKKIGSLGYSAGGHLVSFLGMIDREEGIACKDFPDCSSKVQCVVNYFGPTDLCYYGMDESAQNAIFEPMFGARFKDKPELFKKASPINYITKETAPFLILHGDEDRLVPIDQSRKLNEKLKAVGVTVQFLEFKGQDHGWTGEHSRKSTQATMDFLAENLKK